MNNAKTRNQNWEIIKIIKSIASPDEKEINRLKLYEEDKELQTRLFRLLLPVTLFAKSKKTLKKSPPLICNGVTLFDQGPFSDTSLLLESQDQTIPELKKAAPSSPKPKPPKRCIDLMAERERIRKRAEEDLEQERVYQAWMKRRH